MRSTPQKTNGSAFYCLKGSRRKVRVIIGLNRIRVVDPLLIGNLKAGGAAKSLMCWFARDGVNVFNKSIKLAKVTYLNHG